MPTLTSRTRSTFCAYTGSPVTSDRYENSMWRLPNSARMLEPPLAQPKFLETCNLKNSGLINFIKTSIYKEKKIIIWNT